MASRMGLYSNGPTNPENSRQDKLSRGNHEANLLISSKVANPVGDGPNQRGLSRRHILEQAEASLGRLGVEVDGTDTIPVGSTFVSASAGCTHNSGAVTCALGTNAYIYCWGAGASGVLGNGGFSDSARPEPSG